MVIFPHLLDQTVHRFLPLHARLRPKVRIPTILWTYYFLSLSNESAQGGTTGVAENKWRHLLQPSTLHSVRSIGLSLARTLELMH